MTTTTAAARPTAPVPGQTAMWVFIIGDLFIFSGWFLFYMLNRSGHRELFLESQQQLSQPIGAINTLILLTSSWFIALCVQAAREKNYKRAVNFSVATIACGALFIISKVLEWSTEIGGGHQPTSNDFFAYYYFMTAIHLFHVVCGFIVLGVITREAFDPKLRSQEVIEAGATYWHMIDLLWVMIFALLYLMR